MSDVETGPDERDPGDPRPDRGWPITVVARWIDPGCSRREWTWELAIVASIAWMGLAGVLVGGRASIVLVGIAAVGGLALVWRRVRNRAIANELILEPPCLGRGGLIRLGGRASAEVSADDRRGKRRTSPLSARGIAARHA